MKWQSGWYKGLQSSEGLTGAGALPSKAAHSHEARWRWLSAGGPQFPASGALQTTPWVSSKHCNSLSQVEWPKKKQSHSIFLIPGLGRLTPPFLLFPAAYMDQHEKELHRAWILELRIVCGHLGGWRLQHMLFQDQSLSEFSIGRASACSTLYIFSNLFLLHSLNYSQSPI